MKLLPFLPLLPAVLAISHVGVDLPPDSVGVMAGYTYCKMRENGATHNEAFRQVYAITNGGNNLTPQQQVEEARLFSIVVIDRCYPYAKDFKSFKS